MSVIPKCRGESAGIKMGAPRTVLVNHAVIGKLGAPELIHGGQSPHGDVLQHNREQVVRIWRASGEIDDRFSGDDRVNSYRAGGIWIGGWNSSPRCARTDGNHRGGFRGHFL